MPGPRRGAQKMLDEIPPTDPSVIDFADWKIRKAPKRYFHEPDKCDHKHLTMDPNGHVVQCDDCKIQLSAYSVLERMLEQFRVAKRDLAAQQNSHKAKVAGDLRLTAARTVEKAWRSKHMVPTCPHCSRGIFPADGFGGSMVSKELEIARRDRDGVKPMYGARSAATIRTSEAAMQDVVEHD